MSVIDEPRAVRQTSVLVAAAIGFTALVVAVCIAAPFLPGLDPDAQRLLDARQGPTPKYWLGTDELGRDIFARVIHGAAATIIGPFIVALCAALIAVPLALVAAARGGLVESVIMRLADTLLALPAILIIIVVVGLFGGSYALAVTVLIVLIIPGGLRVIRSAAIGQQSLPYLEAARLMGTKERRIMFVHVLPNLVPTIVATFLLDFVTALVALSSLAFLGLGAPPGSSDWGTMLSENLRIIDMNAWAALMPAILLILTAYSATTIGDWLYIRLGGPRHGR